MMSRNKYNKNVSFIGNKHSEHNAPVVVEYINLYKTTHLIQDPSSRHLSNVTCQSPKQLAG